jgi:hypothetical protein
MVLVGSVIGWPQNSPKAFAGALMHHHQEPPFGGIACGPLIADRDPSAIGQNEC